MKAQVIARTQGKWRSCAACGARVELRGQPEGEVEPETRLPHRCPTVIPIRKAS